MQSIDKTFIDNPVSKYGTNVVLSHPGKIPVTIKIANHNYFV